MVIRLSCLEQMRKYDKIMEKMEKPLIILEHSKKNMKSFYHKMPFDNGNPLK
jgi:hypothetical protein